MKTWTKRKATADAIDAEPDEIVCRPDLILVLAAGGLLSALMIAATVGILFSKHDSGTFVLAGVLGMPALLSVTMTVASVVQDRQRELRASADGLYERDQEGQVRFLAWADINDYCFAYTTSLWGRVQTPCNMVIGKDGARFIFGSEWRQHAPLAKRIKERAVRARAHDWVGFGARSGDDWPRTFHYRTGDNRMLWILSLASVGLAITATVGVCRANLPMIPLMGWGYFITCTLVPSLLALGFAFFVCAAFYSEKTWMRRAQQITLTSKGICFADGSRVRQIEWEAVPEARRLASSGSVLSRYLVQSDDASFDFTARIKDSSLLLQAIIYNAPRVREWRLPEDDSVLPTRHVTGSGGFVHHYRTRNNRFGLGIAWIWWAIPLLALLTQLLMQWAIDVPARDNLFPFAWWWGCLLFPLFGLGWRYISVRVERDTDGLTFYSGRRVRYVLWSQVTDFRVKNLIGKPMDKAVGGVGVGIVDSRVGRFVFFTNISERDRLIRAIEAHVPGKTVAAPEMSPAS